MKGSRCLHRTAQQVLPERPEFVSLFQVYARALSYLSVYKLRVGSVVAANVVLAVIAIAEPILFGRIIDAISSADGHVTPFSLA